MSGLLERVAEFETRKDDVIVAGFPRSGRVTHTGRDVKMILWFYSTFIMYMLKNCSSLPLIFLG